MNPSKISLPEQVASLLARGEPMTAAQLCAATGKSQPSISLALHALGDRVCKMGAARSSRYAMIKEMGGLQATHALFWTEASGQETRLGDITYLQGDRFFLKLGDRQTVTRANALPWYLHTLKPQGFLGRQLLRSRPDLPQNPEQLSVVQIVNLMATRRADPPGAITVGLPSSTSESFSSDADAKARLAFLESLASADSLSLPPKSSAGGEQPKFTLVWFDNSGFIKHELVKYSPPHGTPFGERWKALLQLEHIALSVLQDQSVESASTQCYLGEKRFFLSSQRFDRVGAHGKRHVVAISALHDEFTPSTMQNWVHTAQGLHAKKLITEQELSTIATIHAFGHYIGNTDMHFGNLSFFVDDVVTPKIRLAPVYDMLPMMWRPEIHQGSLSDSPVRPQLMPAGFAQEQARAREWAIEFWEQAAKLDIGADLQAASVESARRLKTNFAGL
jgi:hypothetical protein